MQQEREGAAEGRKILVADLTVKFPEGLSVHLYSSTPVDMQGGEEQINRKSFRKNSLYE